MKVIANLDFISWAENSEQPDYLFCHKLRISVSDMNTNFETDFRYRHFH